MKIEFPESNEEDIKELIKKLELVKFAVFKKSGERVRDMVLLLFSQGPKHSDAVAERLEREIEGEEFIGAGLIHGTRFTAWDSESCKKRFGHDRPDDMYIQALALGEIRLVIRDLVRKA